MTMTEKYDKAGINVQKWAGNTHLGWAIADID